ncbi:MAG: 3-hydroxyacyl-ACP dehydratase FabZ [bacterium]
MTKDIDIFRIMELLPHRYPFLLIDRIESYSDTEVTGRKCVTINEPFFQGHFPGHPIMPGVLIIESLAQTGAVFLVNELDNRDDYVPYFARINNVKFKRPVRPGDVLINKCKLVSSKNNVLKIEGKAYVDGKVVCQGDFTAVLMKKEDD